MLRQFEGMEISNLRSFLKTEYIQMCVHFTLWHLEVNSKEFVSELQYSFSGIDHQISIMNMWCKLLKL